MTGCVHDILECPCKKDCWARSRAVRFNKGNFIPALHPEKLTEPFGLNKPSKIGVCFTGDLFGDWVDPEQIITEQENQAIPDLPLKKVVMDAVELCSQHKFFFLTKNPSGYQRWGKFSDNAWLGASVCNSDMFDKSFRALMKVQAKNKWLSFEPLLDWTHTINLEKPLSTVQWVVIGGQTGRHKVIPQEQWLREIVYACDKNKTPLFLKNNLNCCEISDYPELLDAHGNLRQEFPF
jgi:protein gp37